MVEGNISQGKDKCNASFVAIGWAYTLRLETETYIPANWIQLYPVIASYHQSKGCFLSQDKLALYAGMRKADIKPSISRLIEKNWLREEKYNRRNTYKRTDSYYADFKQRAQFYMIGTELIENGVWAALEQTRQVIYSIMQAFSVHSVYTIPEMIKAEDYSDLKSLSVNGHMLTNCSYLPLDKYDPEKIILSAEKCGIDCSKKTFQRVKKDFIDYGLMIFYQDDDGFFFPRNPGLMAEDFKERLEKIDKAQSEHRIRYAAKRAAIAAIKQQANATGNSKFVKI